jgi:hypothetical protein
LVSQAFLFLFLPLQEKRLRYEGRMVHRWQVKCLEDKWQVPSTPAEKMLRKWEK